MPSGTRNTGPGFRVRGPGKPKATRIQDPDPRPWTPMNPLGIGIIGSGFNAQFHIQAFQQVRDAEVLGVWSPNQKNAAATAGLARKLDVGRAKAYPSIKAMVADP